jgi:hypothetical protein
MADRPAGNAGQSYAFDPFRLMPERRLLLRDGTPVRIGDQRYRATAHGPGADWVLAQAPALLGADDDLTGFDPTADPVVARGAWRCRDHRTR